jgi:hypothetical protein
MLCKVRSWLAGCAAVALVMLAAGQVQAQDPIVRIEEDWELSVKVPDYEITAPQIITAMTPLDNLAGIHATFEINHLSSVAFATGGLHLSTWCGETHLAVCHAGNYASMYTDGEVVRWTQAMSLKDGRLVFEIGKGSSLTWGKFGDDGSLKLDLATTLQDLSTYRPAVSAKESEVSYASNRVQNLVLKQVRYTRASGQTTTENATKYIYQATE